MFIWVGVLVAIVLAWGGRKAYLASKNLVTLDVYDEDVRTVVRKIQWQTWETIVVNNDVKGKVTLNVRGVPMEEVLGVIADQTSSRASAVFPIYSSGKSFVNLRKLARGEATHETVGWTNFFVWNDRGGDRDRDRGGRGGRGGPGGPGGGFGGFGGPGGPMGFDGITAQDAPVTLNVVAKDLPFAATALTRASRSQVVLEDGADAIVSVQMTEKPLVDVIDKVASQAKRKWDVFYTLQARPDFFARDFDDGDRERGDGEGFGRRRFGREGETNRFDTNRWAEMRERREVGMQREREMRLATMTPEEQAKAEEQRQQFENLRDATPEQRQQFFDQMRNNPENRQRFENRRMSYLNNSTPEQRADRTRQSFERRARRQQQGQSRSGR